MRDRLICHLIGAADANGPVPGYLATETPEGRNKRKTHQRIILMETQLLRRLSSLTE